MVEGSGVGARRGEQRALVRLHPGSGFRRLRFQEVWGFELRGEGHLRRFGVGVEG